MIYIFKNVNPWLNWFQSLWSLIEIGIFVFLFLFLILTKVKWIMKFTVAHISFKKNNEEKLKKWKSRSQKHIIVISNLFGKSLTLSICYTILSNRFVFLFL